MTNIGNTPKNNTELWKNHRKWYIFLFLEPQKKIKWHVKYYPKDQIGWDALIDDPYELGFDAPVEDLEKNIQSKDANTEDADSEDVAHKDAVSLDTDLLFRYFNDLKHTGPLLDREQVFWLGMDIQAGIRMSQAISSDGISGVYRDLSDNWDQYFTMIESLRLPSIDWDGAVSVMAQQRLSNQLVEGSSPSWVIDYYSIFLNG